MSERLLFKKKIKKSSRCHVEADLSSGVNDYEGFIRFLVIQADIPFFFLHLIYSLIRLPDQDESENVVKDQQAPLQANREYATLIFHRVLKKTLWAIIGLTAVTMGTGVSGVDWQVTQSEGWLTSETEVQPLKSVKQPGGNNMAAASERVHKLVHLKGKKNISNARLMYKAVRAWLLIQIAFVWLK